MKTLAERERMWRDGRAERREEEGEADTISCVCIFYSFYAELLSIDMNNQSGCEGNLVSHYSCSKCRAIVKTK